MGSRSWLWNPPPWKSRQIQNWRPIPAKAGIHLDLECEQKKQSRKAKWIPAFAGMTTVEWSTVTGRSMLTLGKMLAETASTLVLKSFQHS
jgi:hypothetical protein